MLEIYVTAYNNIFCAEYQIKTLNHFMKDEFKLVMIDNNMGNHPESSIVLKQLCDFHNVEYLVAGHNPYEPYGQRTSEINVSKKHGYALSSIFHGLIKERKPEYFGFLDQDCFLLRPLSLEKYLDEKGMYGKVVPTDPTEKYHFHKSGQWGWNLHPTHCFFKYDFVKDLNLNFMPREGTDGLILDTGGCNWDVLYYKYNKSDYVLQEEHYLYFDDLNLLNSLSSSPTNHLYELIDNSWIHMVHSVSHGASSKNYLEPKTAYIKGFLDAAMLSAGHPGAKLRSEEEFVPTHRNPNKHFSFDDTFYPIWDTIPDHDADEVITQYVKDRIFVETGTCTGRSVKHALVRGAKEVRSVEGAQKYYEACKNEFAHDPRVTLWHGNSVDKLAEMIRDIDEPAVFFLDAHPTGENHIGPSFGHIEEQAGDTSYAQHNVLVEELEIIAAHPIKNHIVLIDDQLRSETDVHEQYMKILLEGNPNYKFRLCNKPVFDSNNEKVFLVAESN